MRISFRLRTLLTAMFSTALLAAVVATAQAQVWKPRTKSKPTAVVKRPVAKSRPRPKPAAAATVKPAAGNNGARPVDLVPDDEDNRGSNDRAERDVRVVRDVEPSRSSGTDRRVGDTEVFVVIND